MVNKLQKRQSSDLIVMPTTNEENTRGKSPSRVPNKPQAIRSNSSERKFKLIRKKSSKDKENLLKGNTLEVLTENKNINNSNEYTKITTPKLKSKANKVSKNCKLFDAVLDDDFMLARKLIIVEEVDVNDLCPEGNSVLHLAAAAGHLDCMELLIECGAKVNAKDNFSRTPLEYAVMYGNFDCAEILIDNGADINVIKNGLM